MGPWVLINVAWYNIALSAEPMSAEEITTAFAGNTSIGSSSRGMAYWVYRKPNGEQFIEMDSGWSDEGKWWIDDDGKLCSKWTKIRKGEPACGKVLRKSDTRFVFVYSDGREEPFKVVKGNPENL